MGTWVRAYLWLGVGWRKSKSFNIHKPRVAQGCSTCMLPILFSSQLLDEVEKAGIGIIVNKDVKFGGLNSLLMILYV